MSDRSRGRRKKVATDMGNRARAAYDTTGLDDEYRRNPFGRRNDMARAWAFGFDGGWLDEDRVARVNYRIARASTMPLRTGNAQGRRRDG